MFGCKTGCGPLCSSNKLDGSFNRIRLRFPCVCWLSASGSPAPCCSAVISSVFGTQELYIKALGFKTALVRPFRHPHPSRLQSAFLLPRAKQKRNGIIQGLDQKLEYRRREQGAIKIDAFQALQRTLLARLVFALR